jgi:hypothetical protein
MKPIVPATATSALASHVRARRRHGDRTPRMRRAQCNARIAIAPRDRIASHRRMCGSRLLVVNVAVNCSTNLSPVNDNGTCDYCIQRANLFIYAPFRFGSRVGKRPVV